MFTVGIFSTHLPYLAFVFFYAFFFLFGIPKATSGELTSSENILQSETHLVQNIVYSGDDDFSKNQDSHFHFYHSSNFELAPREKPRIPVLHREKVKQSDFCFARFCRPPPAA